MIDSFTEAERGRVLRNLNDFVVGEELSSDPAFIVERAHLWVTGQPVAMKRIRPMEGASDNELHAVYLTLVKEFKLMCSVSHPALQMAVGLYNPQNWKAAVLVTPFCENGSLKSFMVQNGSRFNMTMKTVVILGIAVGMRA